MDLKETLKYLKLNESTISMVLGVLVIIFSGVLLIKYLSVKQTSQSQPVQIGDENSLPTTHVIQNGEDLWTISEKYYKTGYNWVDIAKENNIKVPDEIKEGQTLVIPNVAPRTQQTTEITPTLIPPISLDNPDNTSSASTEAVTHTVEKGETLWKIAENYYKSGYNWVDIAQVNKISKPDKIETGQTLFIPNVNAKTPTAKEVQQVSQVNPITGATYSVEKGDSLWTIAVRAYGDGYKWSEISRENKLTHPNVIHPGNVLTIPR